MNLRTLTCAARPATVVVLLALLAAAVAVADVPEKIAGPEPENGREALELEEVWRRGGEDDEEVLLGIITSVLSGPDGNIYVLDAQLMEVKVFDSSGEFVDTLGRQGQGPGEFTNANNITFLPDGSLGVVQGIPGRIIGLNLDGTPGTVVNLGGDPASGGFALAQMASTGGGNLVVSGFEFRMPPDNDPRKRNVNTFMRSYDMAGEIKDEFYAAEELHVFGEGYVLDEDRWDTPARRYDVDHDGRLVVALERDEYRLTRYAAAGQAELVFGRKYESFPRTDVMKERMEQILAIQARQMSPDGAHKAADVEADIWGVTCRPDGTTWILTSRGLFEPPAGSFVMFDVFAPDGTFQRQVTADIPGTPGEDLLFFTDDGHAVKVTGFWDAVLSAMNAAGDEAGEAEPMEIVCYRVL